MIKNSEIIIIGIIIIIFFFSQYQVVELQGTSMCTDNTAKNCRLSPGDLLITKEVKQSEVNLGDVLCTIDGICHEYRKMVDGQYCTTGINPDSLSGCYVWSDIESKVYYDVPISFYRALIILIVGLFIGMCYRK